MSRSMRVLRKLVPLSMILVASVIGARRLVADDIVASFQSACAESAAQAASSGSMTCAGVDGWLFLDKELRHLAAGPFWGNAAATANPAAKPGAADPLPAIRDFHEQLARAGIELLLVPVPAKAAIYSEKLDDRFDEALVRFDPHTGEFLNRLAEAGVSVVDLSPPFREHRNHRELGPLYCRQDSHWSGGGCVLAAQEISNALAGRPWRNESAAQEKYRSRWREVPIHGDLLQAAPGAAADPEMVRLRFVSVKGEAEAGPPRDDRTSPVVLLGDSHNLVFHAGGSDMHAAGAGLADQLAVELGVPVDVVAVRGSGATPARINLMRQARQEGYLARKKLVIWCFSVREFTESTGWPKIAIIP